MRALRPYSILASHYDEVYAVWRELLSVARDEIFRAQRVTFQTVLDIGCGSGWQSLELARRGALAVAVDPVRSFVTALRARARRLRLDVDARVGRIQALPIHPGESFDLAIATFDVLNHLERKADLLPALAEVARTLREGGHLLFDLNTPETIELFPDHHRVVRLPRGVLSAESGRFEAGSGVGIVRRDWFFPVPGRKGLCRRATEEYREISWEEPEVAAALRKAGFKVRMLADAAGWLSFSPSRARWIVLARKS